MKLLKLIAASFLSMGFLSMAVMADEPKDKVKAGFIYVGPTGLTDTILEDRMLKSILVIE